MYFLLCWLIQVVIFLFFFICALSAKVSTLAESFSGTTFEVTFKYQDKNYFVQFALVDSIISMFSYPNHQLGWIGPPTSLLYFSFTKDFKDFSFFSHSLAPFFLATSPLILQIKIKQRKSFANHSLCVDR